MKEIEYLEKIMKIKNNKELIENYFCWLYPFTNENIKGYYSKIDFNNKNVLTVTASGDHALNALLLGAKEIESFDSNPLAKYYSELKIAGIKSLSIEEFILFFYNKSFKFNKYYFNKNVYINRIRRELNIENQIFWDYVFKKYNSKIIFKSKLFTDDFLDIKSLLKANYYLTNNNYNTLKKILRKKNISYHDLSLEKLVSLNKTFDIILLSNVPAFSNNILDNPLVELKYIISKITDENSVIVLNYFYDNLLTDKNNNNIIYNLDVVDKVFKNYECHYIESADILSKSEILKFLYNYKDMVLILKQKTLSKKA